MDPRYNPCINIIILIINNVKSSNLAEHHRHFGTWMAAVSGNTDRNSMRDKASSPANMASALNVGTTSATKKNTK